MMYIINLLMQGSDSGKHCCPTPNLWRTSHDTKPSRAIFGVFCTSTRHHILKVNHREQFELISCAVPDNSLLQLCHWLAHISFCRNTCNNSISRVYLASNPQEWRVLFTTTQTLIIVLCLFAVLCLRFQCLSGCLTCAHKVRAFAVVATVFTYRPRD